MTTPHDGSGGEREASPPQPPTRRSEMKTIEQIRDEIAGMFGYTIAPDPTMYTDDPDARVWLHPDGLPVVDVDCGLFAHPIPRDLDGIAAMMPEGWKWERFQLADGNMVLEATRLSDGLKVNRLEGFDDGVQLTVEDFTCLVHAVLAATKGSTVSTSVSDETRGTAVNFLSRQPPTLNMVVNDLAACRSWIDEKYPTRGHKTGEMLRSLVLEIELHRKLTTNKEKQ